MRWLVSASVFIFSSLVFTSPVYAQITHSAIQRVAVFPLQVNSELAEVGEEAWWEMRSIFTDQKRYLIASKSFLLKKDVYQARAQLTPADAIILGQLLDAHALVTTYLRGRTLHMNVYGGERGLVIWQQKLEMHPSLPIADQLVKVVQKLTRDFLSAIPYQGYVTIDSLIGQATYENDGHVYFNGKVGRSGSINVGDEVQLIRIHSDHLRPLFPDGATIEVYAEGKISEVHRDAIVVELLRAHRQELIAENSLVRLPKEYKRIREAYAIQENLKEQISPEYLDLEMSPVRQATEETKPLVAALTFIGNLAAFLLLAF